MRITPTDLTRFAGVAAVAAGVLFIGVQVGHPTLDAETITTTEMAFRGSLKVLMAGLALVGITGMYLRHVKETGVLGLVGYLLFAAGYLLILGTAIAGAFVLPAIADTNPGYVNDAIAAVTPNGIAMVVLGYSLWQSTRTSTPAFDATPAPRLTTAGVE